MKPYLRDLRADAATLLNQTGLWVVAGVESGVAWPKVQQVLPFEGMDFILRPEDDQVMATICFNARLHRLDVKQGQAKILKLATAMSWGDGGSLAVTRWVSGSHPIGLGNRRMRVVREFMTPDDLPQPAEEEAWVALALFREGLASQNPFYAFLNFFKVIAAIHRDGRARGAWIQGKLASLDADLAIKRHDELRASVPDVARYLFDEGRNAIAHAEKDYFVNPDEPLDYERISQDIPIIRNLAEIAIEEQHKLLRRRTRYKTKGLDIAGFKKAISADLWQRLLAHAPEAEGANIELPESVAIVARRDANLHAYEGMIFGPVVLHEKELRFVLTSPDQTVQFSLALGLEDEELTFEPLEDMGFAREPESPEAIDRAIKFLKFRFCILCNGRVEIWNEDEESLLGATAGYLPLNMMVDPDAFNAQIARLEAKKQELLKG